MATKHNTKNVIINSNDFHINKDTLYLDLLYKMDVGKKKPQMILF